MRVYSHFKLKLQCQFVVITTYVMKTKIVRVDAIKARDARKYVVTVVIKCGDWRMSPARSVKLERRQRRINHPFIRVDLDASRVSHDDQLQLIDEQRLLQLISHAQLETTVVLP